MEFLKSLGFASVVAIAGPLGRNLFGKYSAEGGAPEMGIEVTVVVISLVVGGAFFFIGYFFRLWAAERIAPPTTRKIYLGMFVAAVLFTFLIGATAKITENSGTNSRSRSIDAF